MPSKLLRHVLFRTCQRTTIDW